MSHFICCLSLKKRLGGVSFLHDDVTTNDPLPLAVDWPWMCWFETDAVDGDEREKRCWWHGRPFRISTGTATRRGEDIVESSKSLIRKLLSINKD